MGGAGHHAQIMDGEPGIELLCFGGKELPGLTGFGIIGDNGVVVDHHMQPLLLQEVFLNAVDGVMAFQHIGTGSHFGMQAGKLPARAIVMYDHVMDAQYAGIGKGHIGDMPYQFGIGGLSQQRGNGILYQAPAAPQDKGCHSQTYIAIQIPAELHLQQGGNEDSAGADDIVAAVSGGGFQGGGTDQLSHMAVEGRHPELHQNGGRQDQNGCHSGGDGFRREDLLDAGLCQFSADEQDHHAHSQSREIFGASVSIGVFIIGGTGCQPESQQGDDA